MPDSRIVDIDYDNAPCGQTDPDIFFKGSEHLAASLICATCSQAADCYFVAVLEKRLGTWGGVWMGGDEKPQARGRAAPMMRAHRRTLAERIGMPFDEFRARYRPSSGGVRAALKEHGFTTACEGAA